MEQLNPCHKFVSSTIHSQSSLKEFDDRWTEHFSLIEAGQIQDTASLIRECVIRQGTQKWPELDCFWALPTLQNLEAAFQKLRPRRAPGPDRIPAELSERLLQQRWRAFMLPATP